MHFVSPKKECSAHPAFALFDAPLRRNARSGRSACCRLSVGRAWYALPDWHAATRHATFRMPHALQ